MRFEHQILQVGTKIIQKPMVQTQLYKIKIKQQQSIKTLKTAMSKYSDQRLGQDIIQHYAKYRQANTDYHSHGLKAKTGLLYDFTIPKKYQLIDILGSGSYGVVAAAIDNEAPKGQGKVVAVKKVLEPFDHKIITKRILRQLHLLKLLKHENIINLKTIIMPMARQKFDHIYIVFEFMDTDMHEILRSEQQLNREHFQLFMYQILRGLNYMHAAGIVHRDLKPRNLLLNKNSDLKICDFGLSRSLTHKSKSNELTDYVATRWYRAPQLLLGSYDYDTAVDMWSVGCIFAQMMLRKAFMKGKSTKDQLEIIAQTIGLSGLENMSGISQGGKKLLRKLAPHQPSGSLKSNFKKYGQLQVDLLQKLLAIDPKKRITAVQAMKHPYFQQLYDQSDICTAQPFKPCDFQFEQYNLNTQQLKDILYEEILTYNYGPFTEEYEKKRALGKSFIDHVLVNSNKDNRDPKADQSEEENDQFK